MKRFLVDESETLSFGKELLAQLKPGMLVFLIGELGAGKTTLARGILRAAGHMGVVKSPTYTIVEEYNLNGIALNHFDLYRLGDPEELEWMGIRDYMNENSICLVEWPDRGKGVLPEPDLMISLFKKSGGREVEIFRHGLVNGQELFDTKNKKTFDML